jgi:hypothetical protein
MKNYLPRNKPVPPASVAALTPPKPDGDSSRGASPEADTPAARTNIGPLAPPLVPVPPGFLPVDYNPGEVEVPPGFVSTEDPSAGAFGLDAFGVPSSEG